MPPSIPPGENPFQWPAPRPAAVLDEALDLGLLVGRLGLIDPKGNPRCAAVRPPVIEWSAAAGQD
jgi:hypothetical protein